MSWFCWKEPLIFYLFCYIYYNKILTNKKIQIKAYGNFLSKFVSSFKLTDSFWDLLSTNIVVQNRPYFQQTSRSLAIIFEKKWAKLAQKCKRMHKIWGGGDKKKHYRNHKVFRWKRKTFIIRNSTKTWNILWKILHIRCFHVSINIKH